MGEDLPYVFGAPLASTTPFPSKYSPEERLLSESIMVAWTNFAKTGWVWTLRSIIIRASLSLTCTQTIFMNDFISICNSNPKAPSRDHYLNLEPVDWERYDIDWPEFNAVNMNYLNIGIPPVVNQKYRQKYMQFWNQALPDKLNRTLSMATFAHYPQLLARSATSVHPAAASATNDGAAHINYYANKPTEDPLRTLKMLLNRQTLNEQNEMFNTQSTAITATIIDNGVPYASMSDTENRHELLRPSVTESQQVIVRADATLGILITIIVSFLLLNVIGFGAYVVRRYYATKSMQHKLNVLTLDGATNDVDYATSLKTSIGCAVSDAVTVRNKHRILQQHCSSNDYETVAANAHDHNMLGGDVFTLGSDLSSGTIDAHTKVNDWMCQEIIHGESRMQHQRHIPQSNILQPMPQKPRTGFTLKSRGFFRRNVKPTCDAHDASTHTTMTTTTVPKAVVDDIGRSNHLLPKPSDTIICQDIEVDASLIDGSSGLRNESTSSLSHTRRKSSIRGSEDLLKVDHRHSRSDPVQMYYRREPQPDEDITFFIDDPSMSATRDDAAIADAEAKREPMTADEALQVRV